MNNSRNIIFIYFLLIQFVYGQGIEKGYYMFPIKPGRQNFLTGNMGELRANHFHAGLDIKTDGKEGLPVYAAASGYIARIVVSERGYGKVLFMKHPNGQMTVYAHNKQFEPKLDSIVRSLQYERKSFQVDVDFKKGQLNYRKGDIIAYSGNSGSSGGPHLHFEIRDTSGKYLNPLANGFSEIKDTKPPFISKVALRSLHPYARINNEFGRYELGFKKSTSNLYLSKDTVFVSAGYPIGLEINTYDIMDGIYNLQGVNYISLSLDDSLLFDFALEKFDYEESHCINTHVDFETLKRRGSWYHKCYVADGNIIKSYKTKNRGFITIHDQENHKVIVNVRDYNGNTTKLEFNISARPHQLFYKVPILKRIFPPKRKMTDQLFENILKLEYSDKSDNMNLLAEVHSSTKIMPLAPAYVKGNFTTVYMLDLRETLPDSITICDFVYPLHFKKMIVPKRKQEYSYDNVVLQFDEGTLYDTLFLRFYKDDRGFVLNDYTIPFQGSVGVKLNELHALEDKEHTAAFADGGRGRLAFAGGKWSSDSTSMYYKTKGPGAYTLARDITPPTLKITKKTKKEIMFKASDPGSGIAKYECYVAGQWVLMNYDYKRSLFWSEKRNRSIPFKGELLIRVTDNLGNVREQKNMIK